MQKTIKIIGMTVILSYIIFVLLSFTNFYKAYAITDFEKYGHSTQQSTSTDSGSSSDDDIPTLSQNDKNKVYDANSTINGISSKILGAIMYVCYGAAVIIVLVKGVQIMRAAPDERAKISEQMVGVAIGALILFTIGSIVGIIANIALNNVG